MTWACRNVVCKLNQCEAFSFILACILQCKYNVRIRELRFDWDSKKAKANLKRHGVSFEEAQSTFYDEWAILYDDPDHSENEDRFLLLGVSVRLRILIVSHCYREDESFIRLISARKAQSEEDKEYWKVRK